MKKDEIIVIDNLDEIDVLDDSLYSYENYIFSLTPYIEQNIRVNLFSKVISASNDIAKVVSAVEDLKVKENIKLRLDLLSPDVVRAIKTGALEVINSRKGNNANYLQLKSVVDGLVLNGKEYGKNRKVADIPFSIEHTPKDAIGSMNTMLTHYQLNKITNQLSELSNVIDVGFERMIEGQMNDRFSKLLSCRNSFIQALVISDKDIQKLILANVISEINTARAQLIFQLNSEIPKLDKANVTLSDNIIKGIFSTILSINNTVQLLLYVYRYLGEWKAQLALIKDQENFIKHILLKELHHNNNTYTVWTKIMSNAKTNPEFKINPDLPYELLDSCIEFTKIGKVCEINEE